MSGDHAELRHLKIHLVNGRDDHGEVVADHFAEHFIDLSLVGLGSKRTAEFPLDHGKRRFDVRSAVVVGEERVPLVGEVVVHPNPRGRVGARRQLAHLPKRRPGTGTADLGCLERDEWCRAQIVDRLQVVPGRVRLVGAHFNAGRSSRPSWRATA
jgi:hypothetical protein